MRSLSPLCKFWRSSMRFRLRDMVSQDDPKASRHKLHLCGSYCHKILFLHVRKSMSACLRACWAVTSLPIPLKHNKSYLKPGWMCRGRHSQENHFQPHLCAVSFAYLLLLTGPLWLNSISGGPYSSNRQVQPARAEHGASELAPLRLHPCLNHVDSYGTF